MEAQRNLEKYIPSYEHIMAQRPEILSFKDIKREESYAVLSYRYMTLSAVQSQVIVATLWSKNQFPWSTTKTQEVWGVKVLKDLLVGDTKRKLPFWIGVSNEKATSQGSYYPIRAMAFTDEQFEVFEWAREARDKAQDSGTDRDEALSVYSANTQMVNGDNPFLPRRGQHQHQWNMASMPPPHYQSLLTPRAQSVFSESVSCCSDMHGKRPRMGEAS